MLRVVRYLPGTQLSVDRPRPEGDALCVVMLAARIPQSLVHVSLAQTDRVVSVRFTLSFVQFLSFCALIAWIAFHH
jgi:hypothetical protein